MRLPIIFAALFFCFIIFGSTQANAQWGVSYHQYTSPFVGINYTFAKRFMPEIRITPNRYILDIIPEGTFNYQFVQKEDYQLYAGIGVILTRYEGIPLFPAGVQVYPFNNKKIGFHLEMAAVVFRSDNYLRGTWGVRYRFLRE